MFAYQLSKLGLLLIWDTAVLSVVQRLLEGFENIFFGVLADRFIEVRGFKLVLSRTGCAEVGTREILVCLCVTSIFRRLGLA